MATLVLSAAGAAAGGAIGGSALGLSSAVIGRAVGATAGRMIDQAILGEGSRVVETGRVDRFRLTGASEGAPLTQIYGRTRVSGQVIWASRFKEHASTSGGSGKGGPRQPETTSFSYSISLALALCEGEITRVGRIWADGVELAPGDLNLRVYKGTEDQLPDPKIEAVEGPGGAPAYRGIAYAVIEDLDVGRFGNRVPQFNLEVIRPEQPKSGKQPTGLARGIEAVALMPGTGEYALATTPLHYEDVPGRNRPANVHTPTGKSDLATSLDALAEEAPNWRSTSLIVSWFGDDLRCGRCTLRPKVERRDQDAKDMPWSVSGETRQSTPEIARAGERPIYGGTPTDQSVLEALAACRERGSGVVFYPFILMDQLEGNGLPDPWSDAGEQPKLPWRGRITASVAPGRPGSPDGSAAAADEVRTFFGHADADDFERSSTGVAYSGPVEWSYRRFILHYAHLCAAAGGVDAFCIGSEMRALTQIRGAAGFPAVAELIHLAADVRAILPDTKIGYAADWSEYFGYHPQDGSGDVYFHLDPLWADTNIDFIGIDNYVPLSDWRDGHDHADADWGAIYSLDYLKANIAGGEGYDWYYASPEDEAQQIRTPITDGAHGEPWVFRYKDIHSWWENLHHERIGGVRSARATAWVPRSKPVWFTELGCAAIDKGTNQPNKFLDPKSSESAVPKHSSGVRDDLIQMQYLRAMFEYWRDPANNPVSKTYGAPMVDMSRAHVWAWDARPYPFFPANTDLWSDGANYHRGHWITGRISSRALADVVEEICRRSGVTALDVDRLYGTVRGYSIAEIEGARAALQPLMLAYGFDAVERDGKVVFTTRTGRENAVVPKQSLVVTPELDGDVELFRAPEAETAGRLQLTFVEADGDYQARAAEAVFPDDAQAPVAQSDMPLVLTQAEARQIVERWLAESRVARDRIKLALPPSRMDIGAGDTIRLADMLDTWRVDRVEQAGYQLVEATRVESDVYQPADAPEVPPRMRAFVPAMPVHPEFLDLPLMTGDEVPHAPHIAVAADPWPGSAAVYSSPSDSGYKLNRVVRAPATVGETETDLPAARAGVSGHGPALRVRLYAGALASASWNAVLSGANLAAIGSGAGEWELVQFQRAELVAPMTYELSVRLRGQAGTDGVMPPVWPAGSRFVLVDEALEQIELASTARGLVRHFRIGPASKAYGDPSYVAEEHAFNGVGLRPYAPAHLRSRWSGKDLSVSWIRRTRIDGDRWDLPEVPLGEATEAYLIRVRKNGATVRERTISTSEWSYTAAMRSSDGVAPPFDVEVAQISERFGPGSFARRTVQG